LADEFVNAVGEGLGCVGGGGLAGESSTDQEGDFAADGLFLEGGDKVRESGAAEFFVNFGDFAGEAGGAVAEDFEGIGDGFGDAMRSFVKDEGAVFDAEAFERSAAFASAGREEADEEEFFVRQAGGGERGKKCRRAGDGDDGDLVARTKGDESIARIADEGHACVTDEGDFGALLHGDDEFGGAGHFVVLVIGHQRFADFVMGEEFLSVARVFAGDLVGFLENAEGAKSDVLEIADRGADKVEAAGSGRDEHGASVACRIGADSRCGCNEGEWNERIRVWARRSASQNPHP